MAQGEGWQKSLAQAYEKLKAQVRAYVEHPFHIVKNIFKYKKTRYKGLAKNDVQINVLFALSNLYMERGKLRPSRAKYRNKSYGWQRKNETARLRAVSFFWRGGVCHTIPCNPYGCFI